MMNDQQKETAFLRQCLLYDDTAERRELEKKLTQAQSDERCVRRAVWVMALSMALATAGLCYLAIFQPDYPQNVSLISKVFCALGLGSLICLAAFVGLGTVYRKKLDQRREECRRLATKLLESRLGKPRTRHSPEAVQGRKNLLSGSEAVVVSVGDCEGAQGALKE